MKVVDVKQHLFSESCKSCVASFVCFSHNLLQIAFRGHLIDYTMRQKLYKILNIFRAFDRKQKWLQPGRMWSVYRHAVMVR